MTKAHPTSTAVLDRASSIPVVLTVRDLEVVFHTRKGPVRAVDGVSYDLQHGETLAIVGESGCGKSVSALSVLRLIPNPPGEITKGAILFDGEDLAKVSDKRIREIRGNRISMIFQEPMTSLNPMMTIGDQLAEPFRQHNGLSRRDAMAKSQEMLDLVRIPDAAKWLRRHPHEMSGGMRQRVMIAMALACNPSVLIADEPTTALDVTIQAQILEIIKGLQERLGTAVMMITHDLSVVAETADRVIVMYAGRQVEVAEVGELFDRPMHPYTVGLMKAIPSIDAIARVTGTPDRLEEIPGVVPALAALPEGCAFADRCPRVQALCREQKPPLDEKRPGHRVACWNEVTQ
ncbi:ABC transporter ATP-binding protein [Marinovum sp.]|uniref:ABC transporter ATP-binding protein n=1 Tax=Marinovum sp. TaxID=2024839 RepID=UPI002B27BCE0|nr:ABC transporter ATP-binding protein [Marinovum sp.]